MCRIISGAFLWPISGILCKEGTWNFMMAQEEQGKGKETAQEYQNSQQQ